MHGVNLEDILKNFNTLHCTENGYGSDFFCGEKIGLPVAPSVEYHSPDLYTYKYNNHKYRSIEFSSNIDILTAGCSFTFGTGLPFEYTWSQQLQKRLPHKKVATLSWPGISIQKIISYIFRYFKNIGNPKMIICNFPDFYRFLFLEKSSNNIINYYPNLPENLFIPKKERKQLIESVPAETWGFYINYEYILMLEQYCESNDIKLIWSTWDNRILGENFHISDSGNMYNVLGSMNIHENLKNVFKYFYSDYESPYFYNLFANISFDQNGKIKYSENVPQEFMNCHNKERKETEDFFEVAYDRYIVPQKDINNFEKQLKMSKLEKNKNLNNRPLNMGHFGSHRNIHWAEFYYNIIKQQYPDFI
jgi:hypothetical protein